MMRPGVVATGPAQVYDVISDASVVVIHAPAVPIHGRGATLGGPVYTIRLSSPLDDVIRVTTSHFQSCEKKVPEFELSSTYIGTEEMNAAGTTPGLRSGNLSVSVPDGDGWNLQFSGQGKPLTGSGKRGSGCVSTPSGKFAFAQLSLGVGELVYGLGERFSALVKNGQVVDIWNKDGGTNSDQAYKNVPFYLTNKGYGVFVNHTEAVSFEVGTEKTDVVQFSVPGDSLDYFVIYGPTPKEIINKYTALTGRPALPPAWSFGLWLSTSFTTSYDEKTVTSFIQGMEDRDLPLSVFHFDCFWMKEFHWCDFEWDSRIFPDPPAMLRRLKERGLKICVWINPYISCFSSLFCEGVSNGYFLTRADGDVWQSDQWQPGMAIVDFTNPGARHWYCSHLKRLLDMGVDTFKTDFGERIPTDVTYFDGSDSVGMHNYYSYLYNKTVFDLLVDERGKGDALVFARSATTGSQKLPVHWGGDCESTFEAMAASLRGGLSLGMSGFGFWSHDIGGFEGTPAAELYKRWVAFGLLSSHSRLHGSTSYRVPWIYDDEASDVLRFFTKLKHRLMPYLYSKAIEASNTGVPMMRSMQLELPDDPGCDFLDRQYMLGDSFLVAPIFSADGSVTYYVPPGVWTNFLSGETITGPIWRRETHSYLSLPLLARPNSVIVTGNVDDRPDYSYENGFTVRLFQISEGAKITTPVPRVDGSIALTVSIARTGNTIEIRVSRPVPQWHVLLPGVTAIESVKGGAYEATAEGMHITSEGESYITLILNNRPQH
jgi:alpha-D-xyloside xylohydrolase